MAKRVSVAIRLHGWPEHAAVARSMRHVARNYEDATPSIEPPEQRVGTGKVGQARPDGCHSAGRAKPVTAQPRPTVRPHGVQLLGPAREHGDGFSTNHDGTPR